MKIAPIADIKAHFSTYVRESVKGPVVITRNGRPVGVLLGITDEDEIERLVLAYSPRFREILTKGRREIRENMGLSHEEFWRDVESEGGNDH